MINYKFTFESGETKSFTIDFSSQTPIPDTVPDWMLLETNKCPNCPLKSSESNLCPAAIEVESVVTSFRNNFSYEKVSVRVETPERNYEKNVDVQTGLLAIIGLQMSKSNCPILKKLRGLGKFHLPFASNQEAFFRSFSAFLIKQYFKQSSGQIEKVDLSELTDFYKNLSVLNYHFMQRIRLASKKDANLNALLGLHCLSSNVTMSLEEQLDLLKLQFE
jgi:hypothetical protein